jgi:hypothetical protein
MLELFRPPDRRACDADRETAVDILCAAAAGGRLTMTELDERLGAALTARTIAQLAGLIADVFPAPVWPDDRWALLRSLAESADSQPYADHRGER